MLITVCKYDVYFIYTLILFNCLCLHAVNLLFILPANRYHKSFYPHVSSKIYLSTDFDVARLFEKRSLASSGQASLAPESLQGDGPPFMLSASDEIRARNLAMRNRKGHLWAENITGILVGDYDVEIPGRSLRRRIKGTCFLKSRLATKSTLTPTSLLDWEVVCNGEVLWYVCQVKRRVRVF